MAIRQMLRHPRDLSFVLALFAVWPLLEPRVRQPSSPPPQSERKLLVQQQGGPLLFDPANQKPIRLETGQVSIQLEKENWNLREGWKLAALVRRKGAAAQRIPLPHEMAQVNEILEASPTKAIIVVMLNGDSWVFAVLDLLAYRVVDTVWCYEPTISPDGRYIAFIKFFPTHFVYDVDDHYMLYDTRLSPMQNRPPGTSSAAGELFLAINAGTPVYPPGIGNKDGDNTGVAPEDAHQIACQSFFWWQDSTGYVFADRYKGELYLVKVEVPPTTGNPAVSRAQITQFELCGRLAKAKCYVNLVAIQFQPHQMLAIFQGSGEAASLRKTLTIPDELFGRVR